MQVLVIGGSGFIGTRLIEVLLGRGHDVRNLDLRSSEPYGQLTTIGDVRDEVAVKAAAQHCQAIVNLAAEHRDDVRPVEKYESVNVGGARVVAQVAGSLGISRLVFTSTVAVYGLGVVTPTESSVTAPFNEYGRTKLAAEGVLRAWADADPLRTLVIVRPTVVFGEQNRGNVYTLIQQIASRRFVMIGKGTNHKSMAYVGNVSEYLADQLQSAGGVEISNYTDSPDLSVAELVGFVRAELGGDPRIRFALPTWLGMLAGYAFDLLALVTRRPMPISSVRVRKFCAETSIASQAPPRAAFVAPYDLRDALRRTIRAEFGPAARPAAR